MKRLRLILVLLAALVSGHLRADNLYAYRDSVKNAYDFLLYIPDSYYDSEKPLPLILNLHGKSLTGNDLSMITRYGCIDALRRGRKIDAVVLCPQCRTTGGWDPEKLMQVVEWVRYRFRTDPDRLYVFGISMGGWGTFKFAAAYPDQVAAAIAMCGGYTGSPEPLTLLPLWIIHGTSDRITSISYSTSIVEKMAKMGKSGRVYFSWLTGCDHSILARVFLLQQPYDWLFSHTLKDPGRQVSRDFKIEPKDLNAAYMRLDQSQAQRLRIQNPMK
ncbi:MAG: prolyl oligopeptidase family serine peptidase [Bacteroidales bacterium]|nr:prolyl oligopeptidase family serine peptidase [Bacteroidales bacterium]